MLNVIVYFYWIFDTLLRCPFHLKEKVQFFNLVSLYAQNLQATQNVLQVLLWKEWSTCNCNVPHVNQKQALKKGCCFKSILCCFSNYQL